MIHTRKTLLGILSAVVALAAGIVCVSQPTARIALFDMAAENMRPAGRQAADHLCLFRGNPVFAQIFFAENPQNVADLDAVRLSPCGENRQFFHFAVF